MAKNRSLKSMKTNLMRYFSLFGIVLFIGIVILNPQNTKATAGDPYTFDYQDFWKEYREWGYPAGSRLPCNGTSESTCIWAWRPWYKHTTNLPVYDSERYTGRTVSGYGMMMRDSQTSGHNIDAGIFRVEANVELCHTYRFTMWVRSGLEPATPASTDARMQIGISPSGFAPDQIVLTDTDIGSIIWSGYANPQYYYQNLSLEAEALASSMTLFTRANPTSDNNPYFFWDEGSFSEVPYVGDLVDITQPLPSAQGGLAPSVTPATTYAQISWSTSAQTLGQVLYREVISVTAEMPEPYKVYLPFVARTNVSANWLISSVQDWTTNHSITLTGLKSNTQYEYVVVSYGSYAGACTTLISESAPPRKFTTQ
jgi:hypothetical protein